MVGGGKGGREKMGGRKERERKGKRGLGGRSGTDEVVAIIKEFRSPFKSSRHVSTQLKSTMTLHCIK